MPKPAANYEDEKKELFIANEKNITLYANYRAISVKTDGNRIRSVINQAYREMERVD